MSNWRYVQNGQASTPVDTASLQHLIDNGTLNGDSLVWKEGEPNWLPARNFPELVIPASAAGSGVPPIADASSASSPNVPPPVPSAINPDQADIDNNKVFAILAYIGLLFLVPLLAAPNSKFARYHTNQGIVLFLAAIIGLGASTIMSFVPFLGCLGWVLWLILVAGVFGLMIIGIINAAQGQYKPLPVIGHFQVLK
jgi:uncharacterized membrane protein